MNYKRFIWVLLAFFAVLLRLILPATWIETAYSRGLFQLIRVFFDTTFGLLPFPSLYLFLSVLLLGLFLNAKKSYHSTLSWKEKGLKFLFSLLSFCSALIFFFLILWGYNYGRIPIEKQLSFVPSPLQYEELLHEFETVSQELIQARLSIPNSDEKVLPAGLFHSKAEDSIRVDLENWMSDNNFPVYGKVRGRLLLPKGILLSISTAGVYLPWVGEGHIDAGMYAVQLPFVIAHEMSHGYGFTDEGTCNFIAYNALKQSKNSFFRYSGILGYWYYLSSAVRKLDAEKYSAFYQTLPMGIQNDHKKIREYLNKYPDIMPRFRDAAYDQYLKAQGIEEGMKNYSRVIMLQAAWRKK